MEGDQAGHPVPFTYSPRDTVPFPPYRSDVGHTSAARPFILLGTASPWTHLQLPFQGDLVLSLPYLCAPGPWNTRCHLQTQHAQRHSVSLESIQGQNKPSKTQPNLKARSHKHILWSEIPSLGVCSKSCKHHQNATEVAERKAYAEAALPAARLYVKSQGWLADAFHAMSFSKRPSHSVLKYLGFTLQWLQRYPWDKCFPHCHQL